MRVAGQEPLTWLINQVDSHKKARSEKDGDSTEQPGRVECWSPLHPRQHASLEPTKDSKLDLVSRNHLDSLLMHLSLWEDKMNFTTICLIYYSGDMQAQLVLLAGARALYYWSSITLYISELGSSCLITIEFISKLRFVHHLVGASDLIALKFINKLQEYKSIGLAIRRTTRRSETSFNW